MGLVGCELHHVGTIRRHAVDVTVGMLALHGAGKTNPRPVMGQRRSLVIGAAGRETARIGAIGPITYMCKSRSRVDVNTIRSLSPAVQVTPVPTVAVQHRVTSNRRPRHSRRVARDNTVKYRWRTLQLLPGTERRSYAGAVGDVLEGVDGQLVVRYRGEIIPSQEACETSTALPHTGYPHMAVSTVWAGAGRRPWQHSTRRWTPAMLTTRPSTTALSESASHLPCNGGSPLHFRRQGGTLFRRRSERGCRFAGSPGESASIGTRRRSTIDIVTPPFTGQWGVLSFGSAATQQTEERIWCLSTTT